MISRWSPWHRKRYFIDSVLWTSICYITSISRGLSGCMLPSSPWWRCGRRRWWWWRCYEIMHSRSTSEI